MIFSILVLGSPYNSQSAYTALRFTQAAIESGHQIFRVFFYQDGIHTTSYLPAPPQDEFDLYKAWQSLSQTHSLDVVTCIAAAARRGVIDSAEATRHEKGAANLSKQFDLSGLGQLVEANVKSDKLITFGA